MEAPNKKNIVDDKSGDKRQNLFDLELFFRKLCLQYPEYVISINQKGIISISHKCLNNEIINIELNDESNFNKNKVSNKLCECCKKVANNICLKCEKILCDECLKEHENSIKKISHPLQEIKVVPINEKQYYCKQHCKKVTHYCNFCKNNLCEDECLSEHHHCKNEKLINENTIVPLNYDGENSTLNILLKIANSFYQCYLTGIEKNEMTINIILNLYLIEPINNFIRENKNNSKIIENTELKNSFKLPGEENDYVFTSFRNGEFDKYYNKLIMGAVIGNVYYYHKLNDIKIYYQKLQLYNQESFPIEMSFMMMLFRQIDQGLNELRQITNYKEFKDYSLNFLDLKLKYDQIQVEMNNLELDVELLKKFVITLDYRVDYELRRKIGNIIADKVISFYYDKIDEINATEYLLGLSIEDIERKIIKVKQKPHSEQNETILMELTKKYKNGLTLLSKLTNKKLNINEYLKIASIPKINTSIRFLNKTSNEKDIHEATILNIFFILKKKLHEVFNKDIHNETTKLNYLAKTEIDKYENEKNKELEKGLMKIIDEKELKNSNENNMKRKKEIQNIKTIEKIKHEVICNKLKTAFVKDKIRLEIGEEEYNPIFVIENLIEKKNENITSSLSQFYRNLKEKSSQLFDIKQNLNLETAMNTYFTGEKSQSITPINQDEEKSSKEEDEQQRIKDILNEKSKSPTVSEISNYIKELNQKINERIQDMKDFQIYSIEIIESIGDFFENVDLIIKQLDLSLPLKIPQVIKKIRDISKNPPNLEILEKCFYVCQICIFLCYEEFIQNYNELKEKIEKIKLDDIFLLNAAKIELIREAKMKEASIPFDGKLIENLWEKLKLETKFIDNETINSSISSYFNQFNIKKFQKDFIEMCGKIIKEVDLKISDTQNIFLKPFMKQNNLYYEID